eukprot:CAMPEP_0170826374 /NCGR_PEP_ID=MMETSP0733-20121128/46559_1 /TAXON_ID=186038 /ORGANISM="Fragilariopsis kerguelensis, Strain L26-C5" /LENGTH=46 /DNA_ID= /DNA_START= /DNA_END= /DNA_ORIENTATION=
MNAPQAYRMKLVQLNHIHPGGILDVVTYNGRMAHAASKEGTAADTA